jgi:hypothetical protein
MNDCFEGGQRPELFNRSAVDDYPAGGRPRDYFEAQLLERCERGRRDVLQPGERLNS